ncbi:hypothetical protein [Ancylobacter crimeensis]
MVSGAEIGAAWRRASKDGCQTALERDRHRCPNRPPPRRWGG